MNADIIKDHEKEVLNFFKFLRKHKNIYLYGAGKIGRKYLQILSLMRITPDGFITSRYEVSHVCGIRVIIAKELKKILHNGIGIIATFKDATPKIIFDNINAQCDIYIPTDELYTMLMHEIVFFQFIRKHGLKRKQITPMKDWKNVLVIRQDVLGDGIMTTAFIRELKRNCPDSKITFVARPSNKLLFKNCPYISNLILYDFYEDEDVNILSRNSLKKIEKKANKFALSNLTSNYDIVFHLCPLLGGRGALEALILGSVARSNFHVGRMYLKGEVSNTQHYLYKRFTHLMSYVQLDFMPKHEVECMLGLLSYCGGEIKNDALELWFEKNDAWVESIFPFGKFRCCIAIGIMGRLACQCWPTERFKLFIDEFSKRYHDCGFVLLGGEDSKEAAKEIASGLNERVIDLTGKTTLEQLANVVRKCNIYVGVNTGLMHMAAAMGLPVVEISFFVRSEDGKLNSPMGPWGTKSAIIQKKGLDGCKDICLKPYPHCITQISVQEVVSVVEEVLHDNYLEGD